MANTIQLAEKFVPVIDEIYKQASKTACLDAKTKFDFSGTSTVKLLKVATTGLGDYSRSNGFPAGDVTATWETLTLSEERGKEISVDRMDDEETLGRAFGEVMGSFISNHVAPELDAFRFAKYSGWAGISSATGELTTGEEILAAIDNASAVLDANEAPEKRILYISSALKPALMTGLTRSFGGENSVSRVINSYNDMPVIYVPQSRFVSGVTLNDGSSSWGFAKNGVGLNFLMLCPESVLQAKKMALPKIFDPDTNQDKDAWKFQYRLYHDAFVYDNKAGGIFAHKGVE